VGTKRGLNQFLDGRSVPYTISEGMPSNEAGPVLQDSAGVIWTGTLDAGLARFDGRRFTTLTVRQGLASDTVQTLAEDSDGSLWVGTSRGLNRVRDGNISATFTTLNGLPSADIRSLYRDRSGVLWAGTAAGLASFRQGRFLTEETAPRQPIRAVAENGNGQIVVATEESLYIRRPEGFRELTQDGVYMRNATALYLDREGLLWAGLNGAGLRLVDGEKITSFNSRVGLYDGEIFGIQGDGGGRLWMTCSRGIFWVRRADLLRVASGELRSVNSFAYTPTDSQRVIEARLGAQPSLTITSDGWVWFSTIRGVIAFDLNSQARELPPPKVVIENPIVDGQSQRPEAIADLPAGQKNIEFQYAGLTYVVPESLRFRYRLEGYDSDWINAGTRREAFYTNLPPAEYRFRVMACPPGPRCNGEEASLSFALAPRVYQRAWFWPALAALAGLLGWGAYKLHIRRLRERYDLILSERSRIARELHDTLIQGFSGITMALQALAARIRTPEERATMDDIIHDAATCLRETRQSVAGLRAVAGPHSGLAASIARAVREIAETKDVRLKLSLDPDVKSFPAEVEYNLLRIVSEAVNNSVKHSGANTIEVSLQSTPDAVHLSVKDDGTGFVRENGAGSGHYGLIGMKERATQIGAELELKSEPGHGTTISVLLPAARALEMVK
jgi:signal transduction histidine kinase